MSSVLIEKYRIQLKDKPKDIISIKFDSNTECFESTYNGANFFSRSIKELKNKLLIAYKNYHKTNEFIFYSYIYFKYSSIINDKEMYFDFSRFVLAVCEEKYFICPPKNTVNDSNNNAYLNPSEEYFNVTNDEFINKYNSDAYIKIYVLYTQELWDMCCELNKNYENVISKISEYGEAL